jgi:hypothetical protein
MAANGKDTIIPSKAREVTDHVNRLCKQAAVEKSLALPHGRSDERTANCCGVSSNSKTSEEREKKELKEALYTLQERRGFRNLKET